MTAKRQCSEPRCKNSFSPICIEHEEKYIEELKADLAKYGGHTAECRYKWLVDMPGVVGSCIDEHEECDCGWDGVSTGEK